MTPSNDIATLQQLLDSSPFHKMLSMTVTAMDADRGTVEIRLPYRQEFDRSADAGQIHGGVTAALIDVAGDFAFVAKLGHPVPTINIRIDFLRMAVRSDLIAYAEVRKAGKTIG